MTGGVPTPSVKRHRQRPIQVNGDFSQASTQVSSGIFEVCRLPLGVFVIDKDRWQVNYQK